MEREEVVLFGMTLHYFIGLDQNMLTTPQYNGNIAQMKWQTPNQPVMAYGFEYDEINRLTRADYVNIYKQEDDNGGNPIVALVHDPSLNYQVSGLSYDKDGNILALNRNGVELDDSCSIAVVIDSLLYSYSGNRLQSVQDLSSYFSQGVTAATSNYTYDNNGNLIGDTGKGIQVEYNHLNLPRKIIAQKGTIEIWYDASGRKLRKKVTSQGGPNYTKDYADGVEYTDNYLEAIYHPEGRVVEDSLAEGGYRYEYVITDHLGNSRIYFADLNGDGRIQVRDDETTPEDESEILQENHYYPFGMNMVGSWFEQKGVTNGYQYNGKELNEDLGLGWNDYGARWYDAAIGRWNAVDPLAAKYASISPYAYVANNPILFIDPDGRQIDIGQALQHDKDNGTEYTQTILSDLQEQTGLTLSFDDSGILSYEKSDGKLGGSKRARKMLMKAIDHKETVTLKLRESGGSNVPMESDSKEKQNELNIDVNQISSFIEGTSKDLNSKTYGFGMNFLHELGHTRVGGSKLDTQSGNPASLSSNVKNMNKIRRQLGEDYGQRVDYRVFNVFSDMGNVYFPFSKQTLRVLKKGEAPTEKFVKTPR